MSKRKAVSPADRAIIEEAVKATFPPLNYTPSVGQARRILLDNKIYSILRKYQDGTIEGNGTVIGQLDQPLTAVYDSLKEAIDKA